MTNTLSYKVLWIAALGLCGLILLFLILPTLLVIPMSFSASSILRFPPDGFSLKWFGKYFSDPDWMNATWFSIKIAVFTTLAAVVIGTMAAAALVRGNVPGKELINALLLAPLIVPHIIVAIAVYLQFAPLRLTGTTIGFVLIHTALAVPYVVVIISAALSRLDFSLEMAALNLGASRLRTFLEVTMPLISPAIAAGAVFAFLASFDDAVGIILHLRGREQDNHPQAL
jgi:mannopine transport system permease protein